MPRNHGKQGFEDSFLEDCKLLAKMKNFDIYLKTTDIGTVGFVIDTDHSFATLPIDDKNRYNEVIEAANNYNKKESQKDMDF